MAVTVSGVELKWEPDGKDDEGKKKWKLCLCAWVKNEGSKAYKVEFEALARDKTQPQSNFTPFPFCEGETLEIAPGKHEKICCCNLKGIYQLQGHQVKFVCRSENGKDSTPENELKIPEKPKD